MRHIHLIDTAVASNNVGDEIIVEACRRALAPVLREVYVTTSSGHDGLGRYGRKLAASADLIFLLGTNALTAKFRLPGRHTWSVSPRDLSALEGRVVLFGVGANKDFDRVQGLQVRFLKRVLSDDYAHSVRDAPAGRILDAAGRRWIGTSCPTVWSFAGAGAVFPAERAGRVVFTLTGKKPDAARDGAMIETLLALYDEVSFWPQQPEDTPYFERLASGQGWAVRRIAPNLAAYDAYLSADATDSVGTRLHGGVRALQHGRRTVIVAIDNRARDMGVSAGLTVLARDRMETLRDMLSGPLDVTPTPDPAPIRAFLDQFA